MLTDAEEAGLRELLTRTRQNQFVGTPLRGGLPLVPQLTALPTASIDNVGRIVYVPGASGVADAAWICEKAAAGTYSWVPLDTAAAAGLGAVDFLVGTATGLLSGEIVAGTSPGGELGGTWASPTVDATHSGSAHSSLAPIGADYLVGTANGTLTAEIVVGTSPGGELGGTWASPTVGATHSGSTHASLIPAMQEFLRSFTVQGGTHGYAALAGGANSCVLVAMEPILATSTITQLRSAIGTQSGNVDIGIYSSTDGTTFTRVVSLGATACPAAGSWAANIADTVLTRGTRYFFALAADNNTVTFWAVTGASPAAGVQHISAIGKTSSYPLPSSLTSMNVGSVNPPVIVASVSGAYVQM